MTSSDSVRVAHFSDIHVMVPGCRWRAEDWVTKRLTTWMNLRWLGRGRHFTQAEQVTAALSIELDTRGYQRLLFSGDATALGFDEELVRAVELLRVGKCSLPPGLAVPGNHDYCTGQAEHSGSFERHFAPWQTGERVDGAVYPFAQRAGPIWFIAVNSARANFWSWDASGRVGDAQRQRLQTLLDRLDDAPRVIVTHYPVLNRHGGRERYFRKLRDLNTVLTVAAKDGVQLWLHGHNHRPYYHPASPAFPVASICAGSATQAGLWSYGDYTLTADRLIGQWRVYDPAMEGFRDGVAFELDLRSAR